MKSALRFCANSGLMRHSNWAALLDHRVGDCDDGRRDGETERRMRQIDETNIES
jgi:hypothetical protein